MLILHTRSGLDALRYARRRVRDALMRAGLAVEAAEDMEVAVSEVLSNVYLDDIGPGSVEVLHTAAAVTVVVTDEGGAALAPAIPSALPPCTVRGGWGLYMAGRLVDGVEIQVNPAGRGLTVRMTARLQRGATSPRA